MIDAVISLAQPLPIGNAVRLLLEPPAGARSWKILRKASDTFTGPDDQQAALVYEGDATVLVDTFYLQNDAMVFYRPFYTEDGTAWAPGATAFATPRASYFEHTSDALTVVRDRLEAGLKLEVERGTLAAELGYVQVFVAPPLAETAHFPVVTLHLDSEQSADRGIGDYIGGDDFDASAFAWEDSEGWQADVRLQIIGWSLNADERKALREAIRRIIVGNLTVFAAKGLDQVALEQSDVDAMNGEYGVPQMFQVVNTFTCIAPVRVGGKVDAIREVTSRSIHG